MRTNTEQRLAACSSWGELRFRSLCLTLAVPALLWQAGCAQTSGGNMLNRKGLPGRTAAAVESAMSRPSPRPMEKAVSSLTMSLAEGRSHEGNGQWDKAREVYEKLVDRFPDHAEPRHRLGVVADRQRRHSEAQELYTRAVQLNPRDAELFNDLGYCFFLQGKLEKAESALLKATRLAPDNSRFLNNLGIVQGHQERYDDALDTFKTAGSEADALYNLAFIYASQDQATKAEVCFRQALAVDPEHELARKALESFRDYESRGFSDDDELLSDSGADYVPFVEDAGDDHDGVVQVTNHDAPRLSSRRAQLDRGLHGRAQELLQRNMASLRDDTDF